MKNDMIEVELKDIKARLQRISDSQATDWYKKRASYYLGAIEMFEKMNLNYIPEFAEEHILAAINLLENI